jgi:non-ribosomal peptide synthetase component F
LKLEDIGGEINIDYPLLVRFYPSAKNLRISITFSNNYLSSEEATTILTHLKNAIAQIFENQSQLLQHVDIMNYEEKIFCSSLFTKADDYVSKNVCLHEILDKSATRWPESVALQFETETMNYRDLTITSNKFSNYLHSLGAGPECIIPLLLDDKSMTMVVAIFGILKSGSAFATLDANLPQARNERILSQIQPKIIVTLSSCIDKLNLSNYTDCQLILLDSPELIYILSEQPSTPPNSSVTPQNLAYAVFTSGSTGEPKGVLVEHSSAVCAADALQEIEKASTSS